MAQQFPGSPGRHGAPWPGEEGEDRWDGEMPGVPPAPGTGYPGYPGARPRRQFNWLAAVLVAVVAAAGVAIVVLVARGVTAPAAAANPGGQPGAGAPIQGGGAPVHGGASGGNGGGGGILFLGGQVTAISGTSVTLSAQGRDITAAITGSTKFNGKATSASAIKVGDRVTTQISGYGTSHAVAEAIQDPPQMP